MKAMSATTIRALLLLALPNTRLLISNGECYLIRQPRPKYLNSKVYDALHYAGYISQPQAISHGLAECLITAEGQAATAKIREQMSQYYQLCLFEEEEEEATEAKEAQTQLSLFDDDAEGAA